MNNETLDGVKEGIKEIINAELPKCDTVKDIIILFFNLNFTLKQFMEIVSAKEENNE